MKISTIFLVTLLIIVLIITACSGNTTPTATAPASSTPAPAVTTTAAPAPAATTIAPAPVTTAAATNKPAASPSVAAKPPASGAQKYGGIYKDIAGTGPGAPIGAPWAANSTSFLYMQTALQALLKEQSDASIMPNLAASYDVVSDPANPSITLHLQKGVKFHDGTDFNAQAVKWNLDKVMAPGSTNIGSTTNWKSVEVVDDYTVRVNLKTWQNTAVTAFCNGGAYMVSPTAFQKNGADWMMWNMVGTGPFIQKDFQRDVSMTLTKNPGYWEQGKPYLDTVQLLFVADAMTAQALFKSGGAERIANPSDMIASKMEAAGYKVVSSQVGTQATLFPDSANADSPWSNIKVRLAAEYAIDKEAMAQALGYGKWTTIYQYNGGSNSPAYDPSLTPRKYDVAKAKQLLTEAGYPNGFKTTLWVSPQGVDPNIATALQALWSAVGIKLDIQLPQVSAFGAMVTGSWKNGLLIQMDSPGANPLSGWGATLAPGTASLKSMKRPDGWNDLYNAALATSKLDPALVKKCEDALYNDATEIWIYNHAASWTIADYLMDGGYGTRGSFQWWEPQNAWLNK